MSMLQFPAEVHHLESVCSLAGLTDEDAHVIPEDGRLPVQQVRGQLQGHLQQKNAIFSLPQECPLPWRQALQNSAL